MIALPSYIDPMIWSAFVEQRRAMKVPFTQAAQKLVVMKLIKLHNDGWDVNASLEKSAIYGYRGVFEVSRIDSRKPAIDPALQKIERDMARAAPMPDEIRKKIKELIK